MIITGANTIFTQLDMVYIELSMTSIWRSKYRTQLVSDAMSIGRIRYRARWLSSTMGIGQDGYPARWVYRTRRVSGTKSIGHAEYRTRWVFRLKSIGHDVYRTRYFSDRSRMPDVNQLYSSTVSTLLLPEIPSSLIPNTS